MTRSPIRSRLRSRPVFSQLGADVENYIDSWIQSSDPVELIEILDDSCRELLRIAFQAVGGTEGTVWLKDSGEEFLVAVYNSGREASNLVGFRQPIGSGIISLVYAQQQPYCENEIEGSDGHDDTVDKKMHQHTTAMIAVPFYFAFQLRGVISCVQLADQSGNDRLAGFDSDHVSQLVKAASGAEHFINATLLSAALGLDNG